MARRGRKPGTLASPSPRTAAQPARRRPSALGALPLPSPRRSVQDRYAGDVGDFGKFALLRALCEGRSLGVCWYRTDGTGETNSHAKHLDYLLKKERFENLDRNDFNALKGFVESFRIEPHRRSVAQLEGLRLLPNSTRFRHCQVDVKGA